jgi:hypothetical protein
MPGFEDGPLVLEFNLQLEINRQPLTAEDLSRIGALSYLLDFDQSSTAQLIGGHIPAGRGNESELVAWSYLAYISHRLELQFQLQVEFDQVIITSGSDRVRAKIKTTLVSGLAALRLIFSGMEVTVTTREFLEMAAPKFEERIERVIKDEVTQSVQYFDHLIGASTTTTIEPVKEEDQVRSLADDYYKSFEEEAKQGSEKSLQDCLKLLGYDPGPIDGVLGGQTRAALEKFARAYGVSAHAERVVWRVLAKAAAAKARPPGQR